MRWKYVLLLLTVSACLLLTEARRFGGSGGSRSSSGSRSHGSTSHNSYKPSAPVIHHSTSQVGSHYGGSNVHSYPQSPGLSGSNSGSNHAYPPSSGLSGSNSGSGHSYPPSSGLSGSHSDSGHGYPPNTGLSGNRPSSNNIYPSNTGVSGTHVSGSGYPGQHGYPNQANVNMNPAYAGHPGSIPTNTITHHTVYQTHYVQPPPVIVQQSSSSPFGNIITGLWLYNLGRSTSHHHNGNSNSQSDQKRTATNVESSPNSDLSDCALIVTDKKTNKPERIKLPCEVVNTFAPLGANSTANNSTSSNATISNNATNMTVTTPSQNKTQLYVDYVSTTGASVAKASQNVSEPTNTTTSNTTIVLPPLNVNVSEATQNISVLPNVVTPVPLAPLYTSPTPTPMVVNFSTNATTSSAIAVVYSTPSPSNPAVNADVKPTSASANSTSNLYCEVEMKIKRVLRRTPVECGMLAKLAAEAPLETPPPRNKHRVHHNPNAAEGVPVSTTLIFCTISLLISHFL